MMVPELFRTLVESYLQPGLDRHQKLLILTWYFSFDVVKFCSKKLKHRIPFCSIVSHYSVGQAKELIPGLTNYTYYKALEASKKYGVFGQIPQATSGPRDRLATESVTDFISFVCANFISDVGR